MYILKQFLLENLKANKKAKELLNSVDKIIEETDFSVIYNEKIKLFSIGYNVEEGKLLDSYYDLLASEARQTSLIAIAKRDVRY